MIEITDKDYRGIAEEVYKVDPVKQKDANLQRNVGDVFDINGQTYQVIDAIGNSAEPTTNSLQGMAVAPVDSKGNVDYSQVVVSFVGTNFGDAKDVLNDVESLGAGLKNKMVVGMPSIPNMVMGSMTGDSEKIKKEYLENIVDVQTKTAVEFADRVEAKVLQKNPQAIFSTTGHSLGESVAIYTSLKKKWKNVGFNGPDIHNIISDEEIAYMQAHPEQFRNFRNPNDVILGNILGNKTGVAIYVNMTDGSYLDEANEIMKKDNLTLKEKVNQIYQLGSDYHDYKTWKFNDKGQLIDENGHAISNNPTGYKNALIAEAKTNMMAYYALKTKLQAASGGLSSHQEIFLDSEQAKLIANSLVKAASSGHEQIVREKEAGVEEAAALYKTTKNPAMISALSPSEIEAAFAEGGVTHDSLVGYVDRSLSEKVSAANNLVDEFSQLRNQVLQGISQKLAEDETLAGEFSQWQNMT